ncbi:Wound-induced basic protein [Bienertia sinuspersici]
MIYDINFRLFRSFLSHKGGISKKRERGRVDSKGSKTKSKQQ